MSHDDTAPAVSPQYSPPQQSGFLSAFATADGNVIGLWRDFDGTLHLTYVNTEDDPGVAFPPGDLPAIIELLQRALATLEGRN